MSVCIPPTFAPPWILDVELQKELDAISIRSHFSSSSSSTGYDENETTTSNTEAVSVATTNAKLDMLVNGWRAKEKRLQEYELSLNKIRLWQGGLITDEELEDKSESSPSYHAEHVTPEQTRPVIGFAAMGTWKPRSENTNTNSQDKENYKDLKQAFDSDIQLTPPVIPVPQLITHTGKAPLPSPSNVPHHVVNSLDQDSEKHDMDLKSMETYQATRGDKETVSTEYCSFEDEFEEDPLLMLRSTRSKLLEEFTAVELQRTRELDQRRKAESEESERRMTLASERRLELEEELLKEQKNKLATLEMEQKVKMRLFEEQQRTEEINIKSEKKEMEIRYMMLVRLSHTYKQLEEELDLRRLDENETMKDMSHQDIQLEVHIDTPNNSGSTTVEVQSHLYKCCTQIQALVRGYQSRKKYKDMRSQQKKNYLNLQMENISSEESISAIKIYHFDTVSKNSLSPASSPRENCSNWKLIKEVLERLTNLAEIGSVEELYTCLELAGSMGLDEEASVAEDRLHKRLESMKDWLTQVTNGWNVGRYNLQKQFEEANRLELAPMYAIAEAVVFTREKKIGEGLEMAIARASEWDFYHWKCKATIMEMYDVIRKSYQELHKRSKEVKESLEKETKFGSRDQYTSTLQEAKSLGLYSATEMAMKIILKRVLQFVRRAIVLVSAKSNKLNLGAQDWKTLRIEGAQIGLDMRIMEHLKQSICCSKTLECVRRVWITYYKVNDMGIPYEVINNNHGSVAAWDNTLVYPLTDSESELPLILDNGQRSQDTFFDSLRETQFSLDVKLQQARKMWVMPHNWLEMLRLQSLWQDHMIGERTLRLFSRSGSEEAKNFSPDCKEQLSKYCAKIHNCALSPFIPSSFNESFTLEEMQERQNDILNVERDYYLEREDEHHDYIYNDDEGHEGVIGNHHYMKQKFDKVEQTVDQVLTIPNKSSLTREMLQQKLHFDRKELRWVTRIELINEGLTSLGKKSIFSWCPRVRCLSVDMNRLTTFKQVLEGGEEYLEELSARDNLLEDLTGLKGLQRLTILHLDGNLLSQLSYHKKHVAKEDCTMTTNTCNTNYNLHDHISGQLSEFYWSRLQVLTLSCNRLTDVSQLGSFCPNLEVLDLGSNQLVTLGKGKNNALAGLQHLRVLDVGQNKLKSRSLWEGLKHCPELVSLVASRNNLIELPNHFGSVLLREIWLNGNSIKQLGCKVWLPSLQRLYLQDNLITSLEPLWGCPALEVLDLSFNCISEYSELQNLSGFPNLRSLQLNDNPISQQEDHVDFVLQAVPWLSELDNEAVTKTSRDKAIKTLFNDMMELVGVTFVKEKLTKGDALLRGFTNPCSAHKISFNKREHNENRNGQFSNTNIWEVNDVLNGEADEKLLWAILIEAKKLALSNVVFQNLLKMNAELIKFGSIPNLSKVDFEARSIMTAYQQMTHRLKGKLHAATKERCIQVSKETDSTGQHTYQRWPFSDGLTHLGSQSHSSGVSINSNKSETSHLEWCLEEHATFDPQAYTEVYKENKNYRREAEAHIRRVVKLQALARAHIARLQVKLLLKERKEKRDLEVHKSTVRIQALWRGWMIRKHNTLEYLKAQEVERKLQNSTAITIQALWRGYITRLKFRQALRRAKYIDDDNFEYVRIDEKEFLVGELALASYQPVDMYMSAVGPNSNTAPNTYVDSYIVQDTKDELQTIKRETKEAISNTPQFYLSHCSQGRDKSKIQQTTHSISQNLSRITKQTKNSTAWIFPYLGIDGMTKSMPQQSTSLSSHTSMAYANNITQIDIHDEVTCSSKKSSLASVTNITKDSKIEVVTHTKDSYLQTDVSEGQIFSKAVKSHDTPHEPPIRLEQQSLDELLKSMGFASPFLSETRSSEIRVKDTPDDDICITTSEKIERLINSSIYSKEQAGEPQKTLSDDKKAAMEEISKDWGFKNKKTAEAYLKAQERTMKQVKNVVQQQQLRDPETRFKRFKAKLGGSFSPRTSLSKLPTIKATTCALPTSNCKTAPLRGHSHKSKLKLLPDMEASPEIKKVMAKGSEADTKIITKEKMQGDLQRTTQRCLQGELSPWHIPKLNLNSSLEEFLMCDPKDSKR